MKKYIFYMFLIFNLFTFPSYSNSAIFYYQEGNKYLEQKNYDKAIANYLESIKLNPKNSDAYLRLGFVYHIKQEYDNAIKYYKLALELDNKNAYIYYNLGTAYLNINNIDNAIYFLKKSIEYNPQNVTAYTNLGSALIKNKEYKEAYFYYKEARKLAPNDPKIEQNIKYLEGLLSSNLSDAKVSTPSLTPTPTPTPSIITLDIKENTDYNNSISKPLTTYTSKPNRFLSMGLSLILPGTGQLYKQEWLKGAAYLGLFGLCTWQMWDRYNNNDSNFKYWAYSLIALNILSMIDAYFIETE